MPARILFSKSTKLMNRNFTFNHVVLVLPSIVFNISHLMCLFVEAFTATMTVQPTTASRKPSDQSE